MVNHQTAMMRAHEDDKDFETRFVGHFNLQTHRKNTHYMTLEQRSALKSAGAFCLFNGTIHGVADGLHERLVRPTSRDRDSRSCYGWSQRRCLCSYRWL